MTTVYFIRHAQSDNSNRDGRNRPLTEKGLSDRQLVTEFLQDKNIDVVLSSPFKRAVDTVADFAMSSGLEIETIEDFRERRSDSDWLRDTDFWPFIERQWADFAYKLSDGECLAEVQERNITALDKVIKKYKDKNIVIGTHGTALSTIINYYDKTYDFEDFMAMVNIMPWVVRMDFSGSGCISIEKIDLFNPAAAHDFDKLIVRTADLGSLKAYKFIVVFSRYKNKWLYCRAKARDCYETAGGHVESYESPLEAAKRELYEETGALKYDLTPAFDYSAHFPNFYNTGQVFFAQIHELGDMPDYEMAEVKLFDAIPDNMRFPQILPVLYDKMQAWLKLQSAKDESLNIRTATSADAESLHDLYMNHLTANPPPEPQDMAVWREKLTRFENNPFYHLLVGEIDGRVVSSVTLIIIENLTHNVRPYAVIENVVTHADYRGRHYATELMNRASEIAIEFGCYKIMLLTGSKSDKTFKFYENCDFNRNDKTAFIKWL